MATKNYYNEPVTVDVEVVNNGIIEGRSTIKLERGDKLLDEIFTTSIAPNSVKTIQVSADDLQKTDIGDIIEYRVITENDSKNLSVEVSGVPELSMFQSPILQFNAGWFLGKELNGDVVTSWAETESNVGNATSAQDPVFRSLIGGFPVIDMDGGDGWTFPDGGLLPTGAADVSFAATLEIKNLNKRTIVKYGNDVDGQRVALDVLSDGRVIVDVFGGNPSASGGSCPVGEMITIGGKISASGEAAVYINGVKVGSNSGSAPDLRDGNQLIIPIDTYLNEIVISSAFESDQAFADYHNNRVA